MHLLKIISTSLFSCLLIPSVFAAQEVVVKIGHAAPTSGSIAHLGKDSENGARMAVEELNAKGILIDGKKARFELLTEDDGADPKQGTAVAQKLVDSKVNGVVGHLNSGTSIPAAKIYQMAGIPQVAPSVTSITYTAMGYKTAFRLIANDSFNGNKLGNYAVNTLNAKTIAVIDDRTAFGQGLADQFIKGAKAANPNVRILQRQFTNDKATDFNSILTAVRAGKPDVVFFGGMDAVGGPMLRQMKSLGIHAKFMGGDGICTEKMIALAGDALGNNKVVCAIAGGVQKSEQKGIDEFKMAYKKRFGIDVQIYAPYSYDAVMTLANAMQQGKSINPDTYLPYLQKIHYKGITGNIAFDSKGDLQNGILSLYTYQDGRRTQISLIQ